MCSVNWGIFSTSGDVQYMEDIMSTSGHVQYIRGYHYEYMEEIPLVHWGGGGNIMSTLGDVQHIRGISWCIWGSNLINPFNFYWKPQCTHDIPWCTEHPSMYSWYLHMHHDIPNVLNIPQCIHYIPLPDALMVPSDVLKTPDILMIFPQCTEHPRCTEPHIIQGGFMFV